MVREWKLLSTTLAVLTVGACFVFGPRKVPVSSDRAPASELHQILDLGTIPELRWPDFQDVSGCVSKVYEQNAFGLLWTSANGLTAKGQAVLGALQRSAEYGLNPTDYDVLLLNDWARQLQTKPTTETRQSALLDVALTIELMRFAAALHQGRVDPREVRFAIRPKDHLDLANFVREYLAAQQSLPEMLAQVEPPFSGYRRTVAALVHYRQLAAREPPAMPARPRLPLRRGQSYSDLPALAARLELLGDLASQSLDPAAGHVYGGRVLEAVKKFQTRHGLTADGIIDNATWKALTTPLSERVEQLAVTLERWRWMPSAVTPAIVVNIPEYQLRAYDESGHLALRMPVIVGKAYRRRTPVFEDSLKSIIVRPSWNVPFSIQRGEMVPRIRKDPSYLQTNDLQIVDNNDRPVPWDPKEPILDRLVSGDLRLRQRPGPENSLGLLKFDFPNDYSVYMHGTPARQLFSLSRRDFSHGCIRVEDPESLAEWVLRDDPSWNRASIVTACNGDRTVRIALRRPVTVLVLYGTALVEENGEVHFFDDVYGYDTELRSALAARGHRNQPCAGVPGSSVQPSAAVPQGPGT